MVSLAALSVSFAADFHSVSCVFITELRLINGCIISFVCVCACACMCVGGKRRLQCDLFSLGPFYGSDVCTNHTHITAFLFNSSNKQFQLVDLCRFHYRTTATVRFIRFSLPFHSILVCSLQLRNRFLSFHFLFFLPKRLCGIVLICGRLFPCFLAKSCHIQQLYVSFKDLKWQDW